MRGERDLSNEEVLRDGLAAVLGHGSAVVVDLSEAAFVDSSVLHTLASASRPAWGRPGQVIVVCAQADGFTRRVLRMAGMDRVLRIAETVDDAVRSAAAEAATC